MSSDVVLSVNNIGKRYEIYQAPHHRLLQTLLHGRRQFYKEFWALRDVSFDVKRGECIGIVGRNGSGKSTLLQVVTGTLEPTLGDVEVNGRVSALLELGSGFNPEFTGRENVYMNGAILGLSKAEMDGKFDDIAAFADIGEFIDQPVKIYSSGMYVRLAFAVAINVDPEILIIDEALAVGDARFQARCMTRINKFREAGVSILFVSHDMESVKRICDHAIVLDQGRIVEEGSSLDVLNWYLAFLTNDFDLQKTRLMAHTAAAIPKDKELAADGEKKMTQTEALPLPGDGVHSGSAVHPEFSYFRHGDGNARVVSVGLYDEQGKRTEYAFIGRKIYCRVEVEFYAELLYHIVGLHIRDSRGIDIIAINTFQEKLEIPPVKHGSRLFYTFSFPVELRPDNYSITVTVAYDQKKLEWMDWVDNALIFKIADPSLTRTIFGVYYPKDLKVSIDNDNCGIAQRQKSA